MISVVATCYLLGVSTRRMDKLVQSLGITSLSKSQVSRMATDLDEQVAAFRTRPLGDAGPFTFVAADALTMKVREQGRVVNAVVLVATGVNGDGHREVLGVKVATSETREAWNVFFADLVARGLAGVKLVTSDAHRGLVEAIAANLPGTAWQRCRTHYAANLMSATPKSSWPAVKTMLHSVYDQPDPKSVHAQYDKLLDAMSQQLPTVAEHLDAARADVLAFTQRTTQPRDPASHRRRRHLPRPRRRHPPRRRRPGRTTRRMDRRTPLPRPRRPRPRTSHHQRTRQPRPTRAGGRSLTNPTKIN